MGFKNDDGTFNDRCLERVTPGQPFFVLLAQDETTPGLMIEWLERNPQLSPERVKGVLEEVRLVRSWQANNLDRVKMAD